VKSSHLSAFALAAALCILALASSAQTPPKTPSPSGLTPVQTEERIKQLESRTDAAEKAAASAALEKDYITRVQKQYESYYERVLNTQMWTLGIMGFVLTAVFGLAARFSLDIFDRRVQSAVAEASAQLRGEITTAMKSELELLRKENAAQIKELNDTLEKQIARADEDFTDRSNFQFQAAQALVMAGDGRTALAMRSFHTALEVYRLSKARHLIPAGYGVTTLNNIFIGLTKQFPGTYQEEAKKELENTFYDGLEDELANAAIDIPWLASLLRERRQKPPAPPSPNPS